MQDYPPRIATFFTGTDAAPTPDPDTRSPAAFLRWMLRQQWQVALAAYEGACYRLVPVRVETARGWRRARAWVAAHWRAAETPWP